LKSFFSLNFYAFRYPLLPLTEWGWRRLYGYRMGLHSLIDITGGASKKLRRLAGTEE